MTNTKLDITGMSGSTSDSRDLIIHFRHNVSAQNRFDLLAALNSWERMTDILPCDVKLPPATTIRKGVGFDVLIEAQRTASRPVERRSY